MHALTIVRGFDPQNFQTVLGEFSCNGRTDASGAHNDNVVLGSRQIRIARSGTRTLAGSFAPGAAGRILKGLVAVFNIQPLPAVVHALDAVLLQFSLIALRHALFVCSLVSTVVVSSGTLKSNNVKCDRHKIHSSACCRFVIVDITMSTVRRRRDHPIDSLSHVRDSKEPTKHRPLPLPTRYVVAASVELPCTSDSIDPTKS